MYQYFGGKYNIRKWIVNHLIKFSSDYYLEPFCGLCSVGEIMPQKVKVFSDIDPNLIKMWKMLQGGWFPPKFLGREKYYAYRDNENIPGWLRTFIKIKAGYDSHAQRKSGYSYKTDVLDYHNSAIERGKLLSGARFVCSKYSRMFNILMKQPRSWVVYCDPPYEGREREYGVSNFNYDRFWDNICRLSTKHYVMTSSYVCRKKLPCFQINVRSYYGTRVEKLFVTGLALEHLRMLGVKERVA